MAESALSAVQPTPDARTGLGHGDGIELLARQTQIMELIARGTPLGDVLGEVVLALEELIEGCLCSILLLDPARGRLHHGAAPSLPMAYTQGIDGLRIGELAGSCGAAAYLGVPVVVADIVDDARWVGFRDLATPHGLRACWSSPIRGRAGTVGTFAVYHRHVHRPDEREAQLVERFSHLASVAIDHAGLYGALAESEERFRRAFEDSAVGMALTEPDSRLVKVNRALRELLGRDERSLLGARLDSLLTPSGHPAVPLDGLAVAAVDSLHYEATAVRPDGRIVQLGLAASVVRGADSTPIHLSVNVVDITEREAAERDRAARREAEVATVAAESASRAKSDFVSALSHELRTPLQAITGFTELLGTLDLAADRRRAALDHIGSATVHILSIVDDSLDIAQIEAGALPMHGADVAVGPLTDDLLDLLRPLADEHGVALHRDPPDAVVRADPRRLRQVLINLVSNGVRYNRDGGWVRIGIRGEGDNVVIAVSDSGCGIDPEQLDRLFVPFERLGAEPDGPGVGLGMVLARGLTEAMRGQLRVDSVPGEGTTVAVTLPAGDGTGRAR